jgi:hypothetical protein
MMPRRKQAVTGRRMLRSHQRRATMLMRKALLTDAAIAGQAD